MGHAEELHKSSIVIDATCPLANHQEYWRNYIDGGFTAIAPTINMPPNFVRDTIQRLGVWLAKIRDNSDTLMHVLTVEDIYKAKEDSKLGLIFHFQGSTPFETDLNNVGVYHKLGLRMVQLTYNIKDFVGDGCAERTSCGLSDFGLKLIAELDRSGIVVDCAHTSYQTTMDAIEASTNPVIVSHGNAMAVRDHKRNLPDDVLKAIANNKGSVGLTGYPDFVSEGKPPSLEDLVDHAEYMANLIGIDHVHIGMDYFWAQKGVASDEEAWAVYNDFVARGIWSPSEYSPPPLMYPDGIDMPEKIGNLTAALLKRGFTDEDVKKILGLNLIRVFKQVWGG